MTDWFRKSPAQKGDGDTWNEFWTRGGPGDFGLTIAVRAHKSIDVAALLKPRKDSPYQNSSLLEKETLNLYISQELEQVIECPACGQSWKSLEEFFIASVEYGVCESCGHTTVKRRPREASLYGRFRNSAALSLPYNLDKDINFRMKEIVQPKLDWVTHEWDRINQEKGAVLSTLLDVGAGGGHFVHGCLDRGIDARGIEISQSSRDFAARNFGINLMDRDFTEESTDLPKVDVITFWGLLEYVPRIQEFIQAARDHLKPGGLLFIEVPRIDSLSSFIQRSVKSQPVRHLDPGSHINVFSDVSVVEALVRCKMIPISFWYYGLDFAEMTTHLESITGLRELNELVAGLGSTIQRGLDQHLFCDNLIVAAKKA